MIVNGKEIFLSQGSKNYNLGFKAELVINKYLPNSILCREIDLVWRGLRIEIKATTKTVGNSFLFSRPGNDPDFTIFVGFEKDYQTVRYIWIINRKKLKKRAPKTNRISLNTKSGTAEFLVKDIYKLSDYLIV